VLSPSIPFNMIDRRTALDIAIRRTVVTSRTVANELHSFLLDSLYLGQSKNNECTTH
jgi:hypothetical protein